MSLNTSEGRSLQHLSNPLSHTGVSTGTYLGPDIDCLDRTGLLVFINITAISGTTPTYTVTVEGKDPVSGTYYTILASAGLNATGMTVLKIYPALTAAANLVANDILPQTFRIKAVVAGTTPSVTATIGTVLKA